MSTPTHLLDLSKYKVLEHIKKPFEGNTFKVQEINSKTLYKALVSSIKISDDKDKSNEKKILEDISCLLQFNNPFIIKFIGFNHTDFNGYPNITVLAEYYSNMTLLDLFNKIQKNESPRNWNDTQRLKIIYGIASGMSYAHSKNFIYRNLKPEDILLDENLNPKIIFSPFPIIYEITPQNSQNLSIYTAPELFKDNLQYSTSADVYSFAIIFYALMEGIDHLFKFCKEAKNSFSLIKKINDGERPQFSDLTPPAYRELIENCWNLNPIIRPSFNEIVNALRNDDRFITENVDKKIFLDYCILNEPLDINIYKSVTEIFEPTVTDRNMIENSYQLNKNYKYFIPTATFHLDISPEKIDFTEFMKILPPELMIVDIEKGSTFMTVAFILNDEFKNDQNKYDEIITKFNTNINKSNVKFSVGKIIGKPEIKIPTINDIVEFFDQDLIKFNNVDLIKQINCHFDDFQKEIHQQLVSQQKKNMDFIFNHFELFQKAIENIKQSLKNNKIELIMISQTIIASKDYDEFESIKQEISKKGEDKLCERFLFHGTNYINHPKIADENFSINAKEDDYGSNFIYTTDNIYYATLFADTNYNLIKINQKVSMLCCLAIYNKDYACKADPKTYNINHTIPKEVVNNYGMNYAFVRSKENFMFVGKEKEKEENDDDMIVANEFAFANNHQIIPVCSFNIMRTDFFVLWVDENKNHSDLLNEIKSKLKENVYYSDSIDEALDIVDFKKLNKMKLIISFDNIKWGEDVIKRIRKIIHSNFVCIIYSKSEEQIELSTMLENALFTKDIEDVKIFTKMNLNKNNIIEFSMKLQSKYSKQFNINEENILQFYNPDEKKKIKQYKKTPSTTEKHPFVNNEAICKSCQKNIENSEYLYYSRFEYHKDCLKCSVCQKKIEPPKNSNDFICLTPGMFICKKEYTDYLETGTLPEIVLNEYKEKLIRNLINEIIQPIVINEFNEYLIKSDMIDNSYQLNKNYKYFVPTVTFHFSISTEKIDINALIEILPKEMIIICIEKGSTFLTVAFILSEEFRNDISKYEEIINEFKEKLMEPLNLPIVGNLLDLTELKWPTSETFKNYLSKKSVNLLQNTKIFENIDFEEIKNEIQRKLSLQKSKNKNLMFVYNNSELYHLMDEKVRFDIETCPNELTIVGETIIANKYIENYKESKLKMYEKVKETDKIKELFLYHGTSILNQPKIIQDHFLMPGKDKVKQTDIGYYGKGIYATDNIFYATMYSNDYNLLNDKEKTSILCCISFFNDEQKTIIKRKDKDKYLGKSLPEIIEQNCGVHFSFVASIKGFIPYDPEEDVIDDILITANEFVFPNKYQIVPICSLTVMKPEFFILWINTTDNFKEYLNELKSSVEENVYCINSIEKATEIAENKKRNKIKLVLTFNEINEGEDCIDAIREIYQSKFICLVFSDDLSLKEISENKENVLFTNEKELLLEFAEMDFNQTKLKSICEKIDSKYNLNLRINKQALNFNQDIFIFDKVKVD